MAEITENLDKNKLLDIYERLLTIRYFEEKVSQLFAKNKLPGFVHLYIGQEAVAVGVCSTLNKDDYITSTHRGHGHTIAKGGDVKKMMAELYGKVTGYCKGKGGSMHITDMSIGMLGANGIVAGGLPIALGSAYGSSKIRKTKQVSVSFFGDGATGEGPFWEALNIATAWDLPMIFICENNLYGVGTRITDVSVSEDIIDRVKGFSIPCKLIEGNNVLAVRDAAKEAVARAREGKGPTFIECKTWRHKGHFEGENPGYFDDKEYTKWLEKDPVKIFEKTLKGKYTIDSKTISELQDKIHNMINEAVEYAEESEFPKPEEALEDLYA